MSVNFCAKCGIKLQTKWKNPDTGKTHNIQRRKFCVACSPFGQHNTRNIILPKPTDKNFHTCSVCKEEKQISQFYISNNKIYPYCKPCHNKVCIKRQREVKQKCIDYLGGKCKVCGYMKCNRALIFHHLNTDKKDFDIASYKNRSFEAVRSELDKCILLCSNCHAEVHSDLIQLSSLVDLPEVKSLS